MFKSFVNKHEKAIFITAIIALSCVFIIGLSEILKPVHTKALNTQDAKQTIKLLKNQNTNSGSLYLYMHNPNANLTTKNYIIANQICAQASHNNFKNDPYMYENEKGLYYRPDLKKENWIFQPESQMQQNKQDLQIASLQTMQQILKAAESKKALANAQIYTMQKHPNMRIIELTNKKVLNKTLRPTLTTILGPKYVFDFMLAPSVIHIKNSQMLIKYNLTNKTYAGAKNVEILAKLQVKLPHEKRSRTIKMQVKDFGQRDYLRIPKHIAKTATTLKDKN